MEINSKYTTWLTNATEDAHIQTELNQIKEKEDEIYERFYRELEFGTGGLRGVIGAGTNRMNIYTVRKATQGIANYLLSSLNTTPSVSIAYDSRIKSDLFAQNAASVLAASGIKVYIYPFLMPTPALSYAVRHLKCDAGICITASHNPGKYNGYKVYGNDGCQITLEAANLILEQISQVDPFLQVKYMSFEDGIKNGSIEYIGESVIESFIAAVKTQALLPVESNLKIVYTPLNGAGKMCVLRILKEIGLSHVIVVPEQENPDGNFPTCPYPNPEKEEALQKGLELCKETGADLLLATDPDCDRVGIAVKDNKGNYQLLSGNEVGVLLLDYIAQIRTRKNTMPDNPILVKTIVTTDMAEEVAASYGVQVINTLTGFKFIGEQIGLLEAQNQEERYILGFEESYGYLSGGYVRDKDAVNASMLICEMTSYYLQKGITLIERLQQLYEQFGYYQNKLIDIAFEGAKGMTQMNELMKTLRESNFSAIGNTKISVSNDYKKSISKEAGKETILQLPKSDVLEYKLEDKSKIIIRPSGTEPKLKIYLSACKETAQASESKIKELESAVRELITI